MQSKVCSLEELMSGQVQYQVPPYQRQYVWGKTQWEQLWNDMTDHYLNVHTAEQKGEEIDYYLGPVILIENPRYQSQYPLYDVVDGQQRFITLMVLFSAIKHYATHEKGDPYLADAIDDALFLKNGEDLVHRFIPSQKDTTIYNMTVTHMLNQNYQALHIFRAFHSFKHWISINPAIISDLAGFFDIITKKINLVVIYLTESENPYLVFESVNSKGEDLAESDLVKNLFFSRYYSSAEADAMYSAYWEPMEERFNHDLDELSGFLRHFYMRHGDIIEKRKIFSTIKGLFEDLSADEVKEVTKELSRYSLYYLMILHPDRYPGLKPEGIIRHLIRIRHLHTESPYPFLLHCLDQNDDQVGRGKILSDDEFERILEIIESYLVRRFVCQKKTSTLSRIFSEICPRHGTERIPLNADRVLQNLNEIQKADPPADGEFFEYLSQEDIYRKGTALPGVKVLLTGIEEYLRRRFNENYPDVSQDDWPDLNNLFGEITLELIMPEELTAYWKDQMGEECEKIQAENYHKLGNITITLKKPALLACSSFHDKIPVYRSEQFLLDDAMLEESSWQEEEIRDRTRVLADLAVQTWPWIRKTDRKGWQEGDLPEDQPVAIMVKQQKYHVKYWYQVAERTIEAVGEITGGDYSCIDRILEDCGESEISNASLIRRFSYDVSRYRYKIGTPPLFSFNSKNLGKYEARNIARLLIEELGWDFQMSWSLTFG